MSLDLHDDRPGAACGCVAPRARSTSDSTPGIWSALAPALACAACPACLTVPGTVLSALGVGFALSEHQHTALLLAAVSAALVASLWRAWRTRRAWPLVACGVGAGLVLGGHLADVHAAEWGGVAVLLTGGLTQHASLHRRRGLASAASD